MSAVPSQSTTALDIGAVVASLEHCDLDVLRLHWRNYLGASAPAHLPRWLLMRILSYRLQVNAYGDLNADTKRLLGITSGRNRSSKNNRLEALQDAGTVFCPDGRHCGSDPSIPAGQSNVTSTNGNIALPFSKSQQKPRRAFVKRAAMTLDGQELHPGSLLAREWNGAMHRVIVGEDGEFIFKGKGYGSLSQIAKLITGTNWNGHRFFGLRKVR